MTTILEKRNVLVESEKLSEADLALLLKEPKTATHSTRFVIARLIKRVAVPGIIAYIIFLHIPSPPNVPSGDLREFDPAEIQLVVPSYLVNDSGANTVSGPVAISSWETLGSR